MCRNGEMLGNKMVWRSALVEIKVISPGIKKIVVEVTIVRSELKFFLPACIYVFIFVIFVSRASVIL